MIDLLFEKDTLVQIAVGTSRKTAIWKNIEMPYREFVEKLSKTHKTTETLAEYLSMPKDTQGDIKDVGGFVGGELREGKRKNGYVNYRSMLTLDIDYGEPGILEMFTTKCKNFAHIFYSTHKSSVLKPRLRFIVPLSRHVSAEEYEACGRKLAYLLGINYFDDSTYEPARLMYWASTPSDQEYIFKYNDAKFLNPDELLNLYTDWKDVSLWHYSDRVGIVREKAVRKEANKNINDKTGLIGAFCKTYNIEEAISTFLCDVYKPTLSKDRYTYINGSTSGGLVLYGSDFAYSNHSTDPCSGKLCNSFDLVRLSLFSELDYDVKDNTPANKLPSFVSMCELSRNDKLVKEFLNEEKLIEIKEQMREFGEYMSLNKNEDNEVETANDNQVEKKESFSWLKELERDKNMQILPSFKNFLLILENDSKLNRIGGINLMSGKKEVLVDTLPWNRYQKTWSDIDEACLRGYFETIYNLESKNKLNDAVDMCFNKYSFHPVKDYLNSLTWDGKPRLEELFIDFLGAEDSNYIREITIKFMIAAVKRIMEPGCKFDNMLVLVGTQGLGKSSFFLKLVGQEWFTDSLNNIQGKEAFDALEGKWIVEMPELNALCDTKASRQAIKSFFSKNCDTYRKAYARNVTDNLRQCVFVGTTNENDFLDDPTGNRRFWIVQANADKIKKSMWSELTREYVGQVWAETYQLYKTENINVAVLSKEAQSELSIKHEQNTALDSKFGIIQEFLNIKLPFDWENLNAEARRTWMEIEGNKKHPGYVRTRISAVEIWNECFKRNVSELNKREAKIINDCMRKMPGWSGPKNTRVSAYGIQRCFELTDPLADV